jgi:hypothetical protein
MPVRLRGDDSAAHDSFQSAMLVLQGITRTAKPMAVSEAINGVPESLHFARRLSSVVSRALKAYRPRRCFGHIGQLLLAIVYYGQRRRQP